MMSRVASSWSSFAFASRSASSACSARDLAEVAGMSGMIDERSRVRLITMAWGERYVEELFDFTLPAVLAPNNLPALATQFDCEMVIVTEKDRFDALRQRKVFQDIKQYCPIELRPIDEFITRPDAYGMS